MPTVERVVFIAIPHRGSFRASGFVLNLVRRFVNLPGTLVNQFQNLLKGEPFAHLGISQLPTSVDNMSPGQLFIRTLAEIPIDPRITAHSIIAVDSDAPLDEAGDGVVKYRSAHIDGVASEKIIRSGHSVQENPEAIQEVKRILLEHLKAP